MLETCSIALNDQVDYNDFAERFGTMYAEFRAVYEQEQEKGAKKIEVIDAVTQGSATPMDVSTS